MGTVIKVILFAGSSQGFVLFFFDSYFIQSQIILKYIADVKLILNAITFWARLILMTVEKILKQFHDFQNTTDFISGGGGETNIPI